MRLRDKAAKYTAEAIATFCLVFAGTAAIASNEMSGGAVTHVGVSLVFGLVVLAMIYAVGHISGAHMNPAVTAAFAAIGRLPWREVGPYWAAQAAGGLAASGLVRLIFPAGGTLGATFPRAGVGPSFALEVVITAILLFVVVGVAHDERAEGLMAGVAIGGTIALAALLGGPVSGASMNPIRSLAPALVSGELRHAWLYVAAPMAGALAGAFAYEGVRCRPTDGRKAGACC